MQLHMMCMTKKLVYVDQIPKNYREYVSRIIDVKGNGKYGFRVVGLFLGQGEDNLAHVRGVLLKETHKNDDMYMNIKIGRWLKNWLSLFKAR